MSGIFLTYTWYGKWVDIFQVYVGIFQTYRPSGQIYGIFQEYVRISNFYGFQMNANLFIAQYTHANVKHISGGKIDDEN